MDVSYLEILASRGDLHKKPSTEIFWLHGSPLLLECSWVWWKGTGEIAVFSLKWKLAADYYTAVDFTPAVIISNFSYGSKVSSPIFPRIQLHGEVISSGYNLKISQSFKVQTITTALRMEGSLYLKVCLRYCTGEVDCLYFKSPSLPRPHLNEIFGSEE